MFPWLHFAGHDVLNELELVSLAWHVAPQDFDPPYPVDDETFVRMYCALRLTFPEATLVLSTRESAALRSRLVDICITQLSAGSSTQPGGYALDDQPYGKQFPITDDRTPDEVADWLGDAGFAVTWEMDHGADGKSTTGR